MFKNNCTFVLHLRIIQILYLTHLTSLGLLYFVCPVFGVTYAKVIGQCISLWIVCQSVDSMLALGLFSYRGEGGGGGTSANQDKIYCKRKRATH